ncbi:hypothetical protein H8958_010013, partial [Nasalis larvatus]
ENVLAKVKPPTLLPKSNRSGPYRRGEKCRTTRKEDPSARRLPRGSTGTKRQPQLRACLPLSAAGLPRGTGDHGARGCGARFLPTPPCDSSRLSPAAPPDPSQRLTPRLGIPPPAAGPSAPSSAPPPPSASANPGPRGRVHGRAREGAARRRSGVRGVQRFSQRGGAGLPVYRERARLGPQDHGSTRRERTGGVRPRRSRPGSRTRPAAEAARAVLPGCTPRPELGPWYRLPEFQYLPWGPLQPSRCSRNLTPVCFTSRCSQSVVTGLALTLAPGNSSGPQGSRLKAENLLKMPKLCWGFCCPVPISLLGTHWELGKRIFSLRRGVGVGMLDVSGESGTLSTQYKGKFAANHVGSQPISCNTEVSPPSHPCCSIMNSWSLFQQGSSRNGSGLGMQTCVLSLKILIEPCSRRRRCHRCRRCCCGRCAELRGSQSRFRPFPAAAMKWMFKEDHSLEHRCVESAKIRAKYPDRIPVIVEKVSGSQIVNIDKRKYLVPSDITVAQFMWIIRKRIQLPSEKVIFLFVDKAVPRSSLTMGQLYQKEKDEDGFLYVAYSGENTFGF